MSGAHRFLTVQGKHKIKLDGMWCNGQAPPTAELESLWGGGGRKRKKHLRPWFICLIGLSLFWTRWEVPVCASQFICPSLTHTYTLNHSPSHKHTNSLSLSQVTKNEYVWCLCVHTFRIPLSICGLGLNNDSSQIFQTHIQHCAPPSIWLVTHSMFWQLSLEHKGILSPLADTYKTRHNSTLNTTGETQ